MSRSTGTSASTATRAVSGFAASLSSSLKSENTSRSMKERGGASRRRWIPGREPLRSGVASVDVLRAQSPRIDALEAVRIDRGDRCAVGHRTKSEALYAADCAEEVLNFLLIERILA